MLIVLLAILGPMVSKHSYKEQDLGRAKMPPKIPVIENVHWLPFDGTDQYGVDQYEKRDIKEYFWFGTDDLGRDLLTRTWEGTRISLYIAFLAAVIDLVIGVAYGGISGYYGGRVDNMMQRIIEVLIWYSKLSYRYFNGYRYGTRYNCRLHCDSDYRLDWDVAYCSWTSS